MYLSEALSIYQSKIEKTKNDVSATSCYDGSCVWINNGFGVFLMEKGHIGTLKYNTSTPGAILTGVVSIAGIFDYKGKKVQHTWLRLIFGKRTIWLDLSASQFGITKKISGMFAYLFITDDCYIVDETAEVLPIKTKWEHLSVISTSWNLIKGTPHEKQLGYLYTIYTLIKNILDA